MNGRVEGVEEVKVEVIAYFENFFKEDDSNIVVPERIIFHSLCVEQDYVWKDLLRRRRLSSRFRIVMATRFLDRMV